MNKKILLFLVLGYLTSCNIKNSTFQSLFLELDSSILDYDRIIVVPNEGCGGCISYATGYVMENIDQMENESTAIIFTGIGDMKIFKLNLKEGFLNRANVYIDSENLLLNPEVASIYPQDLSVKEQKIVAIKVFDNEGLVE